MPDPIFNKLGAYLDGELNQRDSAAVEAHLETCQACREELHELRELSTMLRETSEPEFTPASDFKAQLMLQMPRRDETLHPAPNNQVLPLMAPALVLSGWIFIQVTLGLSTLLLLANQAGFLGGGTAWVGSTSQQTLWFSVIQSAIGSGLGIKEQVGLTILNDTGLFMQNMVTLLLSQVGLAVLYWGAMTLVWHNKVKALWNSFTMS